MENLVKKGFVIISLILLFPSAALAETLKVEALSAFSTEEPESSMRVKILEDAALDDIVLYKGDILSGKTTDIVSPKRLKRNASFSFIPETYTDKSGKTHKFLKEYKGRYAFPLDKAGLAKTAGLAIGGYFVKGLSLGVNAIEGAVKNEEGNRLKSSAVKVYENSPLSYIETGDELNILEGDIFLLKFRTNSYADDEEPNYDYTMGTTEDTVKNEAAEKP